MDELASETDGAVTSVAELREEILALSGVDIMQDEISNMVPLYGDI